MFSTCNTFLLPYTQLSKSLKACLISAIICQYSSLPIEITNFDRMNFQGHARHDHAVFTMALKVYFLNFFDKLLRKYADTKTRYLGLKNSKFCLTDFLTVKLIIFLRILRCFTMKELPHLLLFLLFAFLSSYHEKATKRYTSSLRSCRPSVYHT